MERKVVYRNRTTVIYISVDNLGTWVRVGWFGRFDMVATATQRLQPVDDSKEGENGPEEKPKRNGSLSARARRVSVALVRAAKGHGQGDGSREPEYGRQGVEDERGQAVEHGRHVQRRHADVEEHEDRPYRVEDHEVDARGRIAAVSKVRMV